MANKYLDYAGLQRLVENIDAKYAPIAAIIFKSTVADIAHLPELNTVKAGWMYNVTTGGGTTSDFVEGPGHILADGENVACVELMVGTYTAVPTAQVTADKDPKALGWYELDGTDYVLSQDRIADTTKTYYTADTVKKWDILGGVFDLEGRYLEFGTEFPRDDRLVNGRTFLYMGDNTKVYTLVASPEGRPNENGYFEGTFTEVADPTIYYNPKQQDLYEEIEEGGVGTGTYALSEDTEVDDTKTYYTAVFVASADTSVDPAKHYYTEASQYTKAVIYQYDSTAEDWVAQSSGGSGDFVAITNAEIDELFI